MGELEDFVKNSLFITKIYFAIAVFSMLLLFFIGKTFNVNVVGDTKEHVETEFENIEDSHYENNAVVMRKTLTKLSDSGDCLGFYTVHKNVAIYVDGQMVYSFTPSESNLFGHTTGVAWHFISLYSEYEGKQIDVVFTSPYEATMDTVPKMHLGSSISIYLAVVRDNIIPFVLCAIIMLIGIIIILAWIYFRRHTIIDNSLFFLGLFAIMLAMWSINETQLMVILNGNSILSSYAAYISLMLMPVPFIMFQKNLFTDRNSTLWYVLVGCSFVNILVCELLQIFNVYDFRETLWITHLLMVFLCIFTVFAITYEIKRYKLSLKVKVYIICLLIDIIAMILDLLGYYLKISGDSNTFGRIGFLIYIVTVSIISTKDTTNLLIMGRQAKHYEEMAMTDQLTGLHNRTAFAKTLYEADIEKNRYAVIMVDLNNLKICNDTYGHACGDEYIINCAGILKSLVKYGQCFRIGGDEFCVISEVSENDKEHFNCDNFNKLYEQFIEKMHELEVKQSFKTSIKMSMAAGYALSDKSVDNNLDDTRKRADKMMYEIKRTMKEKEEQKTALNT